MDNAIYLGMLPLSPRAASEPLYLDICKECLTATGWEGASQDISLVHYPKQYVYYGTWFMGAFSYPYQAEKTTWTVGNPCLGRINSLKKEHQVHTYYQRNTWPKTRRALSTFQPSPLKKIAKSQHWPPARKKSLQVHSKNDLSKQKPMNQNRLNKQTVPVEWRCWKPSRDIQ